MSDERKGILEWFSRRLNLTEIFSLLTSYGLFYAELDNRKPLPEALQEAREHPMEGYTAWPRLLGLMVVVLIAIEVVTGSLLALYYLPTPESAHDSLGTIVREIHFGWFVHQIHHWAAKLLIVVLILRLIRFFWRSVYRPPRELIWVFAALLLLVGLHLDLTGMALPMTSTAYWSTVRALETFSAIPFYGSLMTVLIGGETGAITDLSLIRFYVLHVALLPLLAILLVYLHYSGVRRVGLGEKSSRESVKASVSIRAHLANQAILLTILFGVLVTLAVLVPVPFMEQVDAYSTLPDARPPWYLLAPFGFLEWSSGFLPQWFAGLLLFAGFTAFLFLPFIDRGRAEAKRRPLALLVALLAVAVWLAFTIYGARVA